MFLWSVPAWVHAIITLQMFQDEEHHHVSSSIFRLLNAMPNTKNSKSEGASPLKAEMKSNVACIMLAVWHHFLQSIVLQHSRPCLTLILRIFFQMQKMKCKLQICLNYYRECCTIVTVKCSLPADKQWDLYLIFSVTFQLYFQ